MKPKMNKSERTKKIKREYRYKNNLHINVTEYEK